MYDLHAIQLVSVKVVELHIQAKEDVDLKSVVIEEKQFSLSARHSPYDEEEKSIWIRSLLGFSVHLLCKLTCTYFNLEIFRRSIRRKRSVK